MAARHFSRGLGARTAARSSPSRSPSKRPSKPQSVPARRSRSAPKTVVYSRELIAELAGMAQRLEVIYSTCVTVQRALIGQNADQDTDIARCLRLHVSEPVSAQVERLQGILGRLQSRWKSAQERP
jgi:hypothetical protein